MTEKEKVIKELLTYPDSYGVYLNLMNENKWDVEKLKCSDIILLQGLLRDVKTFERNKKMIHGGQ